MSEYAKNILNKRWKIELCFSFISGNERTCHYIFYQALDAGLDDQSSIGCPLVRNAGGDSVLLSVKSAWYFSGVQAASSVRETPSAMCNDFISTFLTDRLYRCFVKRCGLPVGIFHKPMQ